MKFSRFLYKIGFLSILVINILSTSCQKKSDFVNTSQNSVFYNAHSKNSSLSNSQKSTLNITAMDTFMTIQCYGDKKNAEIANQKAKEEILKIEKLLSVTDNQSEIFFLNHHQNEWQNVNQTTWEVLLEAKQMAQLTHGSFNPCLYPILSAWGFTTGSFSIPENDTIQYLQ